jgi:CxxC-x17-CxxC domain-containing protein
MKDFKRGGARGGFNKRDNRGGGRGGFGGKPSFGRPSRDFDGPREMFRTICTECGNSCEVPFRPSGDKPVLCNDCFGGSKSFGGDNFPQQTRRGGDRPERNERSEAKPDPRISELQSSVEALTAKIDTLIQTLTAQPKKGVSEEVAEVKKTAKKAATKKAVTKKK